MNFHNLARKKRENIANNVFQKSKRCLPFVSEANFMRDWLAVWEANQGLYQNIPLHMNQEQPFKIKIYHLFLTLDQAKM